MDDLQYSINKEVIDVKKEVLNLVINGWPSILKGVVPGILPLSWGFKPCYKWMTFNTL